MCADAGAHDGRQGAENQMCFSKKVNQWKPKNNSKKTVWNFKWKYLRRENICYILKQLSPIYNWKRELSGVRSTWETAGAHSGVDDFSVTSYRLALLLTARSLTFPYLNVLVSCLSSLACASNAAHWRNNRRDISVSIYSSQITVFWFSQLICVISSLNWLFETGFKRCYGSVIIIITIVHDT